MGTPSLKCRNFEYSVDTHNTEHKSAEEISVLQYNILADAAVPKDDSGHNITGAYTFCPKEFRYMDSRHDRIVQEVKSLSADIVTLQELEADYFTERMNPDMRRLGYSSVCHLRWFDHIGLGIFFKSEKFDLLAEKSFILHRSIKHLLDCEGVGADLIASISNYMKEMSTYSDIIQPPGCLMATLRHKTTGLAFCVATVHITWKLFKYPVLQMLQISSALRELETFSDGKPCIFAGDFNSPPDRPVYSLMRSGWLCERTMNLLVSGNHEDSHLAFNGQKVTDLIKSWIFSPKFKSSYHAVMAREPHITCVDESVVADDQVGLYKGCVDYIWYSSDGFQPTAVLDLPEMHHIDAHEGIPSIVFPSDHLPLYAVFKTKMIGD